jgi:hypothetical protein
MYFDLTGSTLIKKARNYAVFKEYLWWEGPGQHSSADAVYASKSSSSEPMSRPRIWML